MTRPASTARRAPKRKTKAAPTGKHVMSILLPEFKLTVPGAWPPSSIVTWCGRLVGGGEVWIVLDIDQHRFALPLVMAESVVDALRGEVRAARRAEQGLDPHPRKRGRR